MVGARVPITRTGKNVMHGSAKLPTPATVKVAIGDVEAGEQVFVIAVGRGKYDVYKDAEGRDFLGVGVRAEIDRSADAVPHRAESAVKRA
ncbi:hypothetical protein WS50_18955 [Burkholderia territorii]|uniref:hypothetical protein n=1 Tax=Burkholderia territorii TaxID=1503055 RepID=UPI000758DAD3|nr:hypothetical protein [Burkholderia territorii]KUZ02885.1 hypothetical protein WS47_30735 [Burkholderia territorii]KUZ11777.1 hypothetical protein WS50_18955 [Burkholderia territorii]